MATTEWSRSQPTHRRTDPRSRLYLPYISLHRPYISPTTPPLCLPYISPTQAQRSGGFAVGQRVVSLNGHALVAGVSFDEQLSTVAVGSPVILEVSIPADRV